MRMTVCCVGCNSNSNVPSWRVWMDTCDGMFSAEFECWRRCHLNIMWHHIVRRKKRRCSFCPLCECAGVDEDEHVLRYVSLMRWYESWATRWCILINSSTHRILRTRWCFFIRFVDERILIKMFSVCLLFLNIIQMEAMPHHKADSGVRTNESYFRIAANLTLLQLIIIVVLICSANAWGAFECHTWKIYYPNSPAKS